MKLSVLLFSLCVLLASCGSGPREEDISVNDNQKQFESLFQNLKKMVDAKVEEFKKEKDAAKNEFAAKRAENKIRNADKVLDIEIKKFKNEKLNLESFAGLVQSVDSSGVVIVKHGKHSYHLHLRKDVINEAAFTSKNDKVLFSGVLAGEDSMSQSSFLDSPDWIVNVDVFNNANSKGRMGLLAAYSINDAASGDTLCSSANRLVGVLNGLEENDYSYEYYGKDMMPASAKFVNSQVKFVEIAQFDVDRARQKFAPLLARDTLLTQIVEFGYDMANAKELYCYVLEKEGVKLYIPLYFGKQVFKTKEDEAKYRAITNKIADDNFGKGDSLRLTGDANAFAMLGRQPIVIIKPDFQLHP
ncbi:hypothetical protein DesfrDRAFT_0817 [Solidesulfovibrio fructosivorans JJ]]|uniref:Lipoprotein n=1 Tax=Solidesulfovibrio fructosivorans JJ] TaxID=596151 RepID=E1JT68_SOLFR|nr:hypothetical protein [Solidesulfovibrio fructosivorans]EFL52328.1 hypothetical protein DesfrDRAFT_0817 [Solidesulfovibrio fructosivorans JJ]]